MAHRGQSGPPIGVGGKPVADITDGATDGVAIVGRPGSRYFVPAHRPAAMSRLNRAQRDDVDALLEQASAVLLEQDRLRALVAQARDGGVSWHLIGWALGLTGEGARQAYGVRDAGD